MHALMPNHPPAGNRTGAAIANGPSSGIAGQKAGEAEESYVELPPNPGVEIRPLARRPGDPMEAVAIGEAVATGGFVQNLEAGAEDVGFSSWVGFHCAA